MLNFVTPISLILIASPSASSRKMLRKAVEMPEYVFAEASSLYECLDISESHHPQCVLLEPSDFKTDYLPAIEFLNFMNINSIIIIPERWPTKTLENLLEKGVFAILNPPINFGELRSKLKDCLEYAKTDIWNYKDSKLSSIKNIQTNNQTSLQDVLDQCVEKALGNLIRTLGCDLEVKNHLSQAILPATLQHKLVEMLGEQLICVAKMDFTGNFSGTAQILFSKAAADSLALSMIEDDMEEEEIAEMKIDIIKEIGNIVINSAIGSLSNLFNYNISYHIPLYQEGFTKEVISSIGFNFNSTVVLSSTHFEIDELKVGGDLFLFFEARLLLDILFSKE